jgi:flagellar biosynthesis chaperone FliJ
MRTSGILLSLLFLTSLHAVGLGQELTPAPREIPTTTDSAERDITVFFDANFPLSRDDINAIVQSKQFVAAAIKELSGRVPELYPSSRPDYGIVGWGTLKGAEFFAYVTGRQELIRGADGSLPLHLQVEVTQREDENNKVTAEKYAELVIKHLNKVLADLSRRSLEQRLEQLKATVDEGRRQVQMAEATVEGLSARLRQKSGDLPEAVLHELVSDVTKQRQALEVELVGMKGRSEAIQREVARLSERLKKSSADDDVVRNLKRVVALRKEQLALVKQLYSQGVAGGEPGKVAKAEEEVVLAEIDLARATQASAGPTDARLEKLNDELSQIAVGIAENEAKLKYLTTRLDEYDQILSDAAKNKAMRQQIDSEIGLIITLKQKADAAQAKVAQLESPFRPARVEVFELTPREEKPAGAKQEGR